MLTMYPGCSDLLVYDEWWSADCWRVRPASSILIVAQRVLSIMKLTECRLLAYCFSLIPEGRALASWQAIFIAYGCLSVLYGIFVLYWLPDSPVRLTKPAQLPFPPALAQKLPDFKTHSYTLLSKHRCAPSASPKTTNAR